MNTTYHEAADSAPKPDRKPIWIRGAFMVFFLIAFSIAQTLIAATAVIQFLWLMFTQKPNAFLTDFGRSLGAWLQQVARFQSAASEEKPFPWAPWPESR